MASDPAALALTHLKDYGVDQDRAAALLGGCGVDPGSVQVRGLASWAPPSPA